MSTAPTTSISTVRNGVALQRLFGTIDAVRDQPELAQFRFTTVSSWIEGTATRSTFPDWYGIGATREHAEIWSAQSDHPTLGHGHGPTPHEYVLHALAACLTLGIETTAAARAPCTGRVPDARDRNHGSSSQDRVDEDRVDRRGRHRRARRPRRRAPSRAMLTRTRSMPSSKPHDSVRRRTRCSSTRPRSGWRRLAHGSDRALPCVLEPPAVRRIPALVPTEPSHHSGARSTPSRRRCSSTRVS